MVCGVDAPGMSDDITYPSHLKDELLENVGDYFLTESKPAGKGEEEYLSNLKKVTRNISQICTYLIDAYNPDCFSVVFSASDHVQHYFWNYLPPELGGSGTNSALRTAVFDIYSQIDSEIARIITTFGTPDICLVL
jgi:predicted AlkP superfamily phosphohydrolase/phosphomutase